VNEFFSIYIILPAALGPGGYALTEIMFLGSRARPVRRADNLTAISTLRGREDSCPFQALELSCRAPSQSVSRLAVYHCHIVIFVM
jgi:hypothetical protein